MTFIVKNIWFLLCCLLFASFLFVFMKYQGMLAANLQLVSEYDLVNRSRENLLTTLTQNREHALAYRGRGISYDGVDIVYGEAPDPGRPQPYVLLVFNELACNVCQDEETQFGNQLAAELGPDYVRAVVFANSKKFVANYVRMNQIRFPVFWSGDETFLKRNGIQTTPVVFLMDEADRVVASHIPLSGYPDLSRPFHEYCHHYFVPESAHAAGASRNL